MTLSDYPIFRKDLFLLSQKLAVIFAAQVICVVLGPIWISAFMEMAPGPVSDGLRSMPHWFPKLQVTMCSLLALVAAAQWSSEERAVGNDRFLRRLPIPMDRVRGEKTAAGLCILAAVIVIQYLWYLIHHPHGQPLWLPGDNVGLWLVLTTIFAYGIGLPISHLIRQPMVVVLAGIVAVLGALYALGLLGASYGKVGFIVAITAALLTLIAGLVFISGSYRVVIPRWTRRGLVLFEWPIVRHEIRSNFLLYALVLVTGGVNLLSLFRPSYSIDVASLVFMAFLSALVGVMAFRQEEKDGPHCMLYLHGASRSGIFCAKVAAGLAIVALPSLTYMALTVQNWGHLSFWTRLFQIACALAVVAILFCCGLVATLAFRQNLTAVLVAPVLVLIVWAVLSSQLQYAIDFSRYTADRTVFIREARPQDLIYVPLYSNWTIAAVIALLLAAWQIATDREVLAGTDQNRLFYCARLTFFALALVFFAGTTGFGDLLYLVTNVQWGTP